MNGVRVVGATLVLWSFGVGVCGCASSASEDGSVEPRPSRTDDELGGTPGPLQPAPAPGGVGGDPVGNPDGNCGVPDEAALEDVSQPDHVVGLGTKESCTSQAFVDAVARGGVITFDCGPAPVTIVLTETAKVVNDASDRVVIDGGGLITLSGGGARRILYMNTCDQNQVWTTDHCDDQEFPQLSIQNLGFEDGNSKSEVEYDGGGAVWVRGGRVKIINSRFRRNECADEGPDVGGGALRVLSQHQNRPVYVVGSTFGGEAGEGNVCANGGALSSIGVSWSIFNSVFTNNRAVGRGGNPAEEGTPGGGSGGAIYNDGNTMTLALCGTKVEQNQVNAYGSAIFFVSNDHSGSVHIQDSEIRNNTGGGWNVLPGISMHEDTSVTVENSVIE